MNQRIPWHILVLRMFVTLVANVLAVQVADAWIDGFEVDGTGIPEAALIGVLGAVFASMAVRFAFPVVVYSLGFVSILLNMLAVAIAAELAPDVTVESWTALLAVAVLVALSSLVVGWLLALDDEATFTRAVVRRRLRRTSRAEHTDVPGIVFLEIDGCSHGVLQRAMRAGWMPELSSWLGSDHRLERWFTDLSSQTGASQAGILLGSNDGVVAFRWYERTDGRIVVSSNPRDALDLEAKLSSGRGLLADGGASRNNLFSGDAAEASLTLSTLRAPGGATRIWGPFFANPNNVLRTLLLVVSDVGHELAWQVRYRRRGVEPRLKKGWKYPLVRAATTVVMRDLATEMVVADMVRGMPSVYATFVGYDEVAHHDGVERPATLEQLRLLDRTFGRIRRAARFAPRPYEFVVLSDHGQSQGATFLQRYGTTLEDLVGSLAGSSVAAYTRELESVTQLNAALDGTTTIAGDGSPVAPNERAGGAGFTVLASGCLGLVYATGAEQRLTRAQLDELAPGLVDGLVAHPGIGWVLVADPEHGSRVLGRHGSIRLSDGATDGRDPLAGYGPHALALVRRQDRFEHVPDLLVMGRWDPERGEVPAFEELIGSHGGMGGEQGEPFVLFPAGHEWPEGEDVVGAAALHDVMVAWLESNQRASA